MSSFKIKINKSFLKNNSIITPIVRTVLKDFRKEFLYHTKNAKNTKNSNPSALFYKSLKLLCINLQPN